MPFHHSSPTIQPRPKANPHKQPSSPHASSRSKKPYTEARIPVEQPQESRRKPGLVSRYFTAPCFSSCAVAPPFHPSRKLCTSRLRNATQRCSLHADTSAARHSTASEWYVAYRDRKEEAQREDEKEKQKRKREGKVLETAARREKEKQGRGRLGREGVFADAYSWSG